MGDNNVLKLLIVLFGAVAIGFFYEGFMTSPDALKMGESLKYQYYEMGGIFFICLIFSGLLYIGDNAQKKLAQTGIKGVAEILDTKDISGAHGITIKFQLEITIPDRPPYQIEYVESISHNCLDSVRIGAKIPVYVSPNNPKFILLDFPKNKVND